MPMQFGVFYEIQVPKPWYETKVITSAKQMDLRTHWDNF